MSFPLVFYAFSKKPVVIDSLGEGTHCCFDGRPYFVIQTTRRKFGNNNLKN